MCSAVCSGCSCSSRLSASYFSSALFGRVLVCTCFWGMVCNMLLSSIFIFSSVKGQTAWGLRLVWRDVLNSRYITTPHNRRLVINMCTRYGQEVVYIIESAVSALSLWESLNSTWLFSSESHFLRVAGEVMTATTMSCGCFAICVNKNKLRKTSCIYKKS